MRVWQQLLVALGLVGAIAAVSGEAQEQLAPAERQVPASAAAMQLSFSPVVKQAAPGVVNVYASRTRTRQVSPFFNDPFFERFFGGNGFSGMPRERVERSLGSGVIVDPSGIIVTNLHVIADADEIRVTLADKSEATVEIVLKDEHSDLAVLRIIDREGPFPSLALANSDELEVGDLVLAIGNPFGVGQTVTSGIVSALARTQVGSSDDYEFFVQTDAAINPGNSGGALIDMKGRLVGINTMIVSRSGGSIGIGFAVPSNMVALVAQSASSGDRVQRPWLGASLQRLTPELAAGLGVTMPRGALITGVTDGGPAAEAGLEAGDLVLSVDGFEIDDPNGLDYRLTTKGLGQQAELLVMRQGAEHMVSVALRPAPETVPREALKMTGDNPLAGATVVNLSPAVAEEMLFKGAPSGVIVSEVSSGSPADRIGLKRGDIVVEVNGLLIDSTRVLADVAERGARRWVLAVKRDGRILRTMIGG